MNSDERRDSDAPSSSPSSFVVVHLRLKLIVRKTNPPAARERTAGGWQTRWLLLFLFAGLGLRSLRGLRLGHALLELVHAPGSIDELLLAGVERMALGCRCRR
jgi:hypothetical protein